MKKVLSLMLAIILTMSTCCAMVYAEEASAFPDVNTSNTNYEAIAKMKEMGYINGYEDGTFKPDKLVTRAEFVKVLVEQKGGVGNIPDGTLTGFYDVDTKTPHWAYKYIYAGVQKGYINGMGDGTFMPDATITYEQALAILIRFAGKEDSAKFAVNSLTPLWPNAYIITGERLEMHVNTGLSRGMTVSRKHMAQMTYNTLNTLKNNVIVPGGGGISTGGGGGDDSDEEEREYKNVTGVIVSTEGICIDTNEEAQEKKITNSAFFLVKTNSGEYVTFREPIQTNKAGRNEYAHYLGYKVNIRYFVNNYEHNEVDELEPATSMTVTTVNSQDFDRNRSTPGEIVYRSNDGRKSIFLPANLNDLQVVYNGAPLNSLSPAYDYNFASMGADPYITLADLMPKNGSVKFINRDPSGNEVDFVEVTSYETIVAGGQVSASTSYAVTDKYDSSKKYYLKEDTLLSRLNTHYGANRTLTRQDIDVKIDVFSQTGTYLENQSYSAISDKSILNVYASRDLTKIKVIVAKNVYAGLSAGETVNSYNPETGKVKLGTMEYNISDYIYDNFEAGKYLDYESIADMFPIGEKVKARVDNFKKIVYIDIVEPVYEYGYLVKLPDCVEAETVAESALSFRIITKANVSKYSDAANQTYVAPASGKIKLNGTAYKYNGDTDGYDELKTRLKVTAAIINSSKPAETKIKATYAQPIRFIADGNIIKEIITLTPVKSFNGETTMCSENYKLDDYPIYNPATVFSVPDDREEYSKYKVQSRTDIKKQNEYNADIYAENKDGNNIYNCVVLYNEGLTARPSIKSKISIVQSITNTLELNEDTEYIYKIMFYEPSGMSAAPSKTKYVPESELVAVNTSERIREGDVVVYGTDDTIGGKEYIRNINHVLDVSDREKEYFNVKYDGYGELTDSDTPAYQFIYGTVVSVDAAKMTLLVDTGEDTPLEIYEPNMFPDKCKPVYAFYDEEEEELAVKFGLSDRFEGQYIEDIAQMGDKVFIHIYRASSTSITYKYYVVPNDDLNRAYPDVSSDVTYSDITFNVNPDNAKVTLYGIGGESFETVAVDGVATFEDVREGYYKYTVSATNHTSKSDYIIIRNGVDSYTFPEDGEITLQRHKGTVIVLVPVPGALVTVAGQTQTVGEDGIVTFSNIEVGECTYRVECSGYETAEGTIAVTNGSTELEINMVPVP